MEALTIKQQHFLRQYKDWLDQVVEALALVVQFYRDGHEEQGDGLLSETIAGFERFGEENMTMRIIFGQEEERAQEWEQFQQHIYIGQDIPSLTDPIEKIAYITKETLPAFQRWRTIVEATLSET
ncbi:hypothetical protein [Natribacillus halophilus]|uniref:DUF8042 domain-containing protein n=1 Tax=Natribacillus halophilus TaxID=549003 RepID=A0A1G8KN93_9BACI|nr:hypothetical protein [Natribacillus halophilus]SDI44846.1 hypothetical protein SAMN04488123_102208 [Natribacillus halophilus]